MQAIRIINDEHRSLAAVIHGMLHLLGMDHETDHGEMLRLQQELLGREKG